jgi:uncharacterized Zn finger protein (UPF0148 family)
LITCPACGTPSLGASVCPACGTSLLNANGQTSVTNDQPASSAVIDVEVRDVSGDR